MGIDEIALAHADERDLTQLSEYEAIGGYEALRKARGMEPGKIIEELMTANLRGRGGAGFPMGRKASFLAKGTGKPTYLCVNADESEPGTFKDREIMLKNPHRLIEGCLCTAHGIESKNVFIYLRGEYLDVFEVMRRALEDARAAGLLEDVTIVLHRGAGAYICGDETGLIESLEGKKGQPRPKPPFPAIQGVFDCPTVVNNVETISALPWIMNHGADAYAAIGTEKSKGTMLFSISGMVERPGVYESAFGVNLWEFIEQSTGGVKDGKKLKAVIPGGSSSAILTAEEARNVKLDYESIAATGAMVGSGAIMVIDEDTSIVKALEVVLRFYAHESCGQCPPCREGTYWLYEIVHRIREGKGRPEDIDLMLSICPDMMGRTICVLADSAAIPAASYIKKFRPEFEAMINRSGAPERRLYPGGVNLESRAL